MEGIRKESKEVVYKNQKITLTSTLTKGTGIEVYTQSVDRIIIYQETTGDNGYHHVFNAGRFGLTEKFPF